MHHMPDWEALRDLSWQQAGFFTTEQGALFGFSSPLLNHHIKTGRVRRVRRGIYRLCELPRWPYGDVVVAWLWSRAVGVISHETALALHLHRWPPPADDPREIHLTLPPWWRTQRRLVPQNIRLHYGYVSPEESVWMDAMLLTSLERTKYDLEEFG